VSYENDKKNLDFMLSSSSSPRLLPVFPLSPEPTPTPPQKWAPKQPNNSEAVGFPFCVCFFSFQVGGSNPFEKYDSQNGNLPQIRHENNKYI